MKITENDRIAISLLKQQEYLFNKSSYDIHTKNEANTLWNLLLLLHKYDAIGKCIRLDCTLDNSSRDGISAYKLIYSCLKEILDDTMVII